ncbi:hypothetical protein LQW54_009449 [Pestalotiopsis sp. IQ-011]
MADGQSTMHRNSTNANTSLLDIFVTLSYASWPLFNIWICDDRLELQHTTSTCTWKIAQPHVDYWNWISTPVASGNAINQYHYVIDYCLSLGDDSSEMDEKCALRFYPDILLGNTLGNSMSGTPPITKEPRLRCLEGLWSMAHRLLSKIRAPEEIIYTKASMVTLGDYISSSLEHPDHHTAGLDLSTEKDFDRPWQTNPRTEFVPPKKFTFIDVLSRRKWVTTYVL